MKIVKSSCSSKRKVRTCTFSPQVNIKNKRTAVQTEQDVNAAHSEAKLQDLINDIKSNIYTKVKAVATSPEFGFDENEVDDYFFVEVSATEIGEDHHEAIRVEVRGEVSYEGLEDLMEALNPIIESYDSYAYFEPVEPGIIEAYVSVNQIDMSIYGATASPDHMFYDYHGKRFSVHDNSSEIGEDSIDDVYFLWKGSISQQAGAYNDADEDYVYAFIRGRGVIEYYKKGKYVATDNYTLRDEDDFEYAWEYMEIILQHICDRLIAYNKDVPDRMVYNSTDIEDSSDDSIMFEGNNYEYVTNNDGYWVYRAVIDGKGVWRAMPQGSNESQFEELSFPISYAQARGFEPINEPTAITKLRKDLGKKLLSKSGRSVEATTEYLDIGGILGEPNARYSSEDLRSIYEEGKHHDPLTSIYEKGRHHDPLISQYDSYESWFKDIEQYLYEIYSDTEDITSSTDDKVFIEDILDGLEDNGYDLSRIRSIRQGLLALFGYKGKDADIIIHDLVAGRFIDPNDWVDKDYIPGIYSATQEDDGEGYWFFTTHGIQPGSVPKDVDILDIIDTPNGSFVKFDRFLSTEELNEYDMKERDPKSVMSAEAEERRAEDNPWVEEIDWVMNQLPSWFEVNGSNLEYDVTYDDQTVHVEFFLFDGAKYTYYIDGHGPYTTNQSEKIGDDIEDYINEKFEDIMSATEEEYDEEEYDEEELQDIIDELTADGFDATDEADLLMGLGADLGMDLADARYYAKLILNHMDDSRVFGTEEDEDSLPMVDQEYDSAATSINSNKLPATER